MHTEKLRELLNKATPDIKQQALELMLAPHMSPVFGAAKSVEHEIAALNALKMLGYLTDNADEFELVENLRVTKPKARALLYQAALRKPTTPAEIDRDLRELLRSPLLAVDGEFYMIEVPQPLTMDRLRQRVRALRFLSDGTFSGSVARIKRPALAALVEDLIDKNAHAKVFGELRKAGYEGTDARSVINAMIKKVGATLAGQVGEELLGRGGEAIGWVFDEAWARLRLNPS